MVPRVLGGILPPLARPSIDPALLRPGRFDRRIPAELPDPGSGSRGYPGVRAKKIKTADSVRFDEILAKAAAGAPAQNLPMCAGAALPCVCDGRKFAYTGFDLRRVLR